MIELIVGRKGKGKTKVLLEQVNTAIKEANGNIVYLDKNTKHMYELNNKVRLIDSTVFPIKNADEFVGFICGILSQDHDLEENVKSLLHLRGEVLDQHVDADETRAAHGDVAAEEDEPGKGDQRHVLRPVERMLEGAHQGREEHQQRKPAEQAGRQHLLKAAEGMIDFFHSGNPRFLKSGGYRPGREIPPANVLF